jgi:hypothetical protein
MLSDFTACLVNDVCVVLSKTVVYGSIPGFEGQFAILPCNATWILFPWNRQVLLKDARMQLFNGVLYQEHATMIMNLNYHDWLNFSNRVGFI